MREPNLRQAKARAGIIGTPAVRAVASVLVSGVFGWGGAACTADGGQTGSPFAPPSGPVVPPDRETPNRFRVPTPDGGGGGPSPTYPERPGRQPQRISANGDVLYVADASRGLVIFDASTPDAPVLVGAMQLPGGAAWLDALDGKLTVIGGAEPGTESFEAGPSRTRVLVFDVASDPRSPALLGQEFVDGALREAVADPGRVVLLTELREVPTCHPDVGPAGYGYWGPPRELLTTEFQLTDAGPALADQRAVMGESYLGAEHSFVITRGSVEGFGVEDYAVTVVDFSAPGALWTSPEVPLEGHVRSSPARFEDDELVFVSGGAAVVVNRVRFDGDAPPTRETLALPFDSNLRAEIGERHLIAFDAVLDGSTGGTIVDLDAPTLSIVGELPTQWGTVHPVHERWLALGEEGAALFTVTEEGTAEFDETVPLAFAAGGDSNGSAWVWNEEQGRWYFPYASHVGAFDVSGTELVWLPGSATHGFTVAPNYSGNNLGVASLFTRTSQGYALTYPSFGEFGPGAFALEPFDVEVTGDASPSVSLGDRPIDVAIVDALELRLAYGPSGERELVALKRSTGVRSEPVALRYATEGLARVGGDILGYSLHPSNGCYAGDLGGQEVEPGETCTDDGTPAISHFIVEDGIVTLEQEIPLPVYAETLPADTRGNWEWLELVVQGEQAGLLQNRRYGCESVTGCDALGIEPKADENGGGSPMCDEDGETVMPDYAFGEGGSGAAPPDENGNCPARPEPSGGVRGYRSEQWYYPLNLDEGGFDEPIRVADATGYSYFTADGIVNADDDGAIRFLDFTVLVLGADGISAESAKLELATLVAGEDGPEIEHTTIAGFPLRVDAESVVTLEPGALLGADGAAVDVLVHHLEIYEGQAYFTDTLNLGPGHTGHRWASDRGFVLLVRDDQCAEPTTTLVAVEFRDGVLRELGRTELAGTNWAISAASDERVVLWRAAGPGVHYATLDVTSDAFGEPDIVTLPNEVPVAIEGSTVVLGAEADR